MKAGILFTTIITGGILMSAGISMATETKGAESIILRGGSMGSVTFPHGRHQGALLDCMPCHDLFPKEAEAVERMKAEGKLQRKEVMNLCRKCHSDLAEKGQKTGPTGCRDCHKK